MEENKNRFFTSYRGRSLLVEMLNHLDVHLVNLRDQKDLASKSGNKADFYKTNNLLLYLYKLKNETIRAMAADRTLRFYGLVKQQNGNVELLFSRWMTPDRKHMFLNPATVGDSLLAYGEIESFEGVSQNEEVSSDKLHSISYIKKQFETYLNMTHEEIESKPSLFNEYNRKIVDRK